MVILDKLTCFYLSGPQQVRWGLIRPSTPKSLLTPDVVDVKMSNIVQCECVRC